MKRKNDFFFPKREGGKGALQLQASLRWYHTFQVRFDLFVLFSYFFGSVFEYIHCNKYQNFNKIVLK